MDAKRIACGEYFSRQMSDCRCHLQIQGGPDQDRTVIMSPGWSHDHVL